MPRGANYKRDPTQRVVDPNPNKPDFVKNGTEAACSLRERLAILAKEKVTFLVVPRNATASPLLHKLFMMPRRT